MPKVTVNGVDRSTSYSQAQLGAIQILQIAADGEIGQGQLPLPDPAGTYETYAGEPILIEDGVETIMRGFVGPTTRDRGEGALGPRRAVGHTLLDENSRLFGMRAYRWERPAETTRARFLAFLAAFVPAVTDTTWVLSTNVANMKKKSYTTETLFGDLFKEIQDLTGNTAFVEGGRAHLHLHTQGIVSTISVSDVVWDFVNIFPPDSAQGPVRNKDPHDLANDILVKGPNGGSIVRNAASIARHDVGGLKHQKILEVDDKTSAARLAKGQATIAEVKDERITYECDIGPLTAAQVNAIPPGCLMSVTSQVFGLTASTQRLAARTLSYKHPGKWYAHLEFGYPIRIRLRPPRIAVPAPFVPGETITPGDPAEGVFYGWGDNSVDWYVNGTLVGDNSSGSHESLRPIANGVLVSGDNVMAARIVNGVEPIGWSFGNPTGLKTRVYLGPDDSGTAIAFTSPSTKVWLVEDINGVINGTPANWNQASFDDSSWPTADEVGSELFGGFTLDGTLPPTAPSQWIAPIGAVVGTFDRGLVWLARLNFTTDTVTGTAPAAGQEVIEAAAGNGATTAFTTNYPYIENSLRVHVGGVAVVPTQTDPDAGTFSLPFAPASGTQILISYLAADGTPTGAVNDPTPDSVPPTIPAGVATTRWEPVVFDNAGTPEPVYFQDAAGVWDIVMHEVPV